MITQPTPLPMTRPSPEARLREAAQELEASFIAEMLRAAGAEKSTGFGPQDSEFASFLLDARAREIAQTGGLGLAEVLFESMVKSDAAG